jgi:hypothetical protein
MRAGRDEVVELRADQRADSAADFRAGDAGAEQRKACAKERRPDRGARDAENKRCHV